MDFPIAGRIDEDARELDCDRSELHKFRHRLQDHAHRNRDDGPPADEVVEPDEAYQNGGKGGQARRPRRSAGTSGQQAAVPQHLGE